MDSFHFVQAIFEFVVLLFSLSLHEAAHAWMASRLGDPTARMLGRVTLNPIKHIDLVGTVIIPLFMLFMPGYGFLVGWAKPTPVTPSNFKNITRDDILTTLAGPFSNILAAVAATVALLIMSHTSQEGAAVVHLLASGMPASSLMGSSSIIVPLALLLHIAVWLNIILFVFNLIPLPPLDGSHVVRHMLPYNALRVYDSLGLISLLLVLFVGYKFIGFFITPMLGFIDGILRAF
jgi:Zn-dependent protease